MIVDLLVSLLLLIGAAFALIGSLALVRLPDFFSRLHGPTKATTLGVGGLLAGSLIYFGAGGEGLSVHEVLIVLFLFMTAPVSAHLITQAALHSGLDQGAAASAREVSQDGSARDPGVDCR